jgi:hypothetical protein
MSDLSRLLRSIAGKLDGGVSIRPSEKGALITFANGRRQLVVILREDRHYVMVSLVIGASRVQQYGLADLLPRVWLKNRETHCVAFGLDSKHRLVGRINQIADTLDREELAYYLLLLARECDQFEYSLTGQDIS